MLQSNGEISVVQHVQVRIFGGDRRETYQCLHPEIGQHFDIDPGKAYGRAFEP